MDELQFREWVTEHVARAVQDAHSVVASLRQSLLFAVNGVYKKAAARDAVPVLIDRMFRAVHALFFAQPPAFLQELLLAYFEHQFSLFHQAREPGAAEQAGDNAMSDENAGNGNAASSSRSGGVEPMSDDGRR